MFLSIDTTAYALSLCWESSPYHCTGRGFFFMSHRPSMTAALAYTHAFMSCLCYIALRLEYRNNKHGECEKQPEDRLQPPADEQPVYRMMLFLELCFTHYLHINIFTATFRTFHIIHLSGRSQDIYNIIHNGEREAHYGDTTMGAARPSQHVAA